MAAATPARTATRTASAGATPPAGRPGKAAPPAKPPKKSKFDEWIKDKYKKTYVSYRPHSEKEAGGRAIVADLYPTSFVDRPPDFQGDFLLGYSKARRKFMSARLSVVPLLSGDLGGDMINTQNMTMLMPRAADLLSRRHADLRQAVAGLRAFYAACHKIAASDAVADVLEVIIRVKIGVGGDWGPDPPDSFICDRLTVEAELVNEPKREHLARLFGPRKPQELHRLLLEAKLDKLLYREVQLPLSAANARIRHDKPA